MTTQKYKGYPEFCFAINPANECLCRIYPGDDTRYGIRRKDVEGIIPDPEHYRSYNYRYLNRQLGVTPAQGAAMMAGMHYGWDSKLADPMAYNQSGVYAGV